jgi:hypothetical protein
VEDCVIRALVALVLTAAAAAVLVLALQVHRWQTTLARDDLRFEVAPTAGHLWAPPQGRGADVARRLLGVDDDLEFRRAERLFVDVHISARTYAGEQERLAAFGQAQSNLEKLSRSDASPDRRARAANLLGILLWENASTADENTPLLLAQTVDSFKRAVRAYPAADDAKYNLELLETLLVPGPQKRLDAPEQGGGTSLRGAGIASAGKGY